MLAMLVVDVIDVDGCPHMGCGGHRALPIGRVVARTCSVGRCVYM
jgi:hypothetical protein